MASGALNRQASPCKLRGNSCPSVLDGQVLATIEGGLDDLRRQSARLDERTLTVANADVNLFLVRFYGAAAARSARMDAPGNASISSTRSRSLLRPSLMGTIRFATLWRSGSLGCRCTFATNSPGDVSGHSQA